MEKDKLNPQKPGITQPRDPKDEPHPRQPQRGGGAAGEPQQPQTPQDGDKRRQVPIEGE
jgi:hypothetical protein